MASPRWVTNQRPATVAAKVIAIAPVPRPTSRPQYSVSCHAWVVTVVSTAPRATRVSAPMTTERMPKRSISAAENGAVTP